jgi:hypothetical protein
MERIVGISEAADEPGVSISTCAARGWGLGAGGKLVVEHPAVGQKAEELSPIAVCRRMMRRSKSGTARRFADGSRLERCEKSQTSGRKLCGVSLWRKALWRGSQVAS